MFDEVLKSGEPYIVPRTARAVEDFFREAANLRWGLLGVPKAFVNHISYHQPYIAHHYNQAGLAVARGKP